MVLLTLQLLLIASLFGSASRATLAANPTKCTLPARTALLTIASPTTIIGNDSLTYDDSYASVKLPFVVTFGNITANTVYVSVNGILTFAAPQTSYNNTALPNRGNPLPQSFLPNETLAAFWDDLIIIPNFGEGIYYDVVGPTGARNVSIEWFVSLHHNPFNYAHFVVTAMEAHKAMWVVRYVTSNGFGNNATAGAQTDFKSVQFSYNQAKVLPGMVLELNSAAMSITKLQPGCKIKKQQP